MTDIFGICGWSGSGKTDLICRLIKYFTKQKLIVSTIKHTHHNFEIDKKGKDSFKHRENGAYEVLIGGSSNFALIHSGIKSTEYNIHNLKKKLSKENDLILVEGFKKSDLPKIEVYYSCLNKEVLWENNKSIKALVYDIDDNIVQRCSLPKYKFEETKKIANFISKFLKLKI